ncbi:hypothetical protein G443_004270 [Actinoalloteichus cyanogriseus DSM 43889]|uniref:Uncharacterized protein n=1 Tax=Actinoalloteichus caeruleus DSM 43889 TaxID=1120930 RepID=A0ABT1JN96_ACTCY|nr:hypothetical protein [Actinoalloteichus caeruleus DSM 43889]
MSRERNSVRVVGLSFTQSQTGMADGADPSRGSPTPPRPGVCAVSAPGGEAGVGTGWGHST